MEKWRRYRDGEMPVFSVIPEKQEAELLENEQLCDFGRLRCELKDDPHRPIYHFVRPDGSLNDPNGLCFWEGRWHLFYQALDPCIHWGHAVSDDMVYWRDLPYAIAPSIENHCFSGGTCVDTENHRVIAAYYGYTGYTGFNTDDGYRCGVVIATSSDPLLLNWTKVNDGNPVIPDRDAPCWTAPDAPPVKDQKPYQVFDSYIWKEDGVYYLLTGGYTPDPVTGRRFRQMHLFKCTDDGLTSWEFVKHFLEHDRFRDMGDDGACPYFVPIGDDKRALLHFSHRCVPKYLIGEYNKESHDFVPFSGGRFTSGYEVMVAPSAFPCPDNSIAVIFNMMEQLPHNGWNGIMTLPRRMALGGHWNDELCQTPFGDMSVLHKDHREMSCISLTEGKKLSLDGICGNAFEMKLSLKYENIPQTLEIEVLCSPDGEETTKITFFRHMGGMYAILPYSTDSVIMLDATRSSLDPRFTPLPPETSSVVMQEGDDLNIRIFVDKSIVEVFVNDRHCVNMRAYPTRTDSNGVALLARGTDGVVDKLDFWEMRSIYSCEE
ncbi:MAG: glycoside hydrolase family 32 protein [Ruminococcaceae bacterium]|nr:glycoside hydrolase family 32 protein [Oscillospiraceae bacterium]